MDSNNSYDLDEHLFSPAPLATYQFLCETNASDLFDLNNLDTKPGVYPSQNSTHSSPSYISSETSSVAVDFGFYENQTIDFSSVTQPMEKLRIIAQPKAFYRERYCSETDPSKNRAQRFIRADDDKNKYEYPTVQFSLKDSDFKRELYIRVTLVTSSDHVSAVCIHPYTIDTPELDVIRDSYNNSLYFPLTIEDTLAGQKSFRISRKKMIQNDLRSYGLFRLFDINQHDIQRVLNIHDAKQIIDIYQLWKSQLVFTIAERINTHHLPVPISHTSVTSQIMFDEASARRKESMLIPPNNSSTLDDDSIICSPRKGAWIGGDDILMVIPKLDRRKSFNIYFDYGSTGKHHDIKITLVDSRTIFFQTPSCRLLTAGQNLVVPIVIVQSDVIIGQIDFTYLAPTENSMNIISQHRFDSMNLQKTIKKRPHYLLERTEYDGGESLVEQMARLSTCEKHSNSTNSNDVNARFDKYLTQLQEAIVEFIRTNNPSKLFRRTRLLLAKCEENPSPIEDAIRNGYIDLVLKLIEQLNDQSSSSSLLERENDQGQTLLLISAELNHSILIETLLKKRFDLSNKTDKHKNNIFHLLARRFDDDQIDKTIKTIRNILPQNITMKLLKQKNSDNQQPWQIAEISRNTRCIDLLRNV